MAVSSCTTFNFPRRTLLDKYRHVVSIYFLLVSLTKQFSLFADWQTDHSSIKIIFIHEFIREWNINVRNAVNWYTADIQLPSSFCRSVRTPIMSFMIILPEDQIILTCQCTQHWSINWLEVVRLIWLSFVIIALRHGGFDCFIVLPSVVTG
jgi:hypothetical protein